MEHARAIQGSADLGIDFVEIADQDDQLAATQPRDPLGELAGCGPGASRLDLAQFVK